MSEIPNNITSHCPECHKEIEIDYYDYLESCENNENGKGTAYCIDCNLCYEINE